MTTALAVTGQQDWWDDKQIAVLSQIGMRNAPKAELALFLSQCQRTGLDPFAKQIYMIERGGKWTIQAGIDGLRIIAERSGGYCGQTAPQWCGADGQWTDIWLGGKDYPPAAARVGVWRDGFKEPLYGIAMWEEYGAGNGNLWRTKPAHMLAKVAESHALRKAFPQSMSGLYTDDEMPGHGQPQQAPRRRVVTAADRLEPVDTSTGEILDEPPLPEPPDEIPDAELVEDGMEEFTTNRPQQMLATPPQSRKLHAMLRAAGLGGKDNAADVLTELSTVTGRDITTTKELRSNEMDAVYAHIQMLIDANAGAE